VLIVEVMQESNLIQLLFESDFDSKIQKHLEEKKKYSELFGLSRLHSRATLTVELN